MSNIKIETFRQEYAAAFKALNEEWISTYFVMEPSDYAALDNPESYIINKGGEIFVSVEEDMVLGVCALIKVNKQGIDYELAKMAVSPAAQGKGVGFLLGKAAIDWAKEQGAKTIFLDSNTKLQPAINLYKKLGFIEVTGFDSPYNRVDIQMMLTIN